MKKSYLNNYLKIYVWQGFSFVLKFISMFAVTPYISKEPSIYGIYIVCISVTIYLTYADFGFLRSGQKYASESFARGNRDEEMQFIGFGIFILLVFTLLCASVFYYFSIHPQQLIKGLDSKVKVTTASNLLLILSVFTPFTVIQKMVLMIFEIRLESYFYQRIALVSSVIVIGSAFYFFSGNNYYIVRYFAFYQLTNSAVVVICLLLAKQRYSYSFKKMLKCIKFDLIIYNKVKGIAYSSLYVMIMWIVFYELDNLVIGKFFGAERVAVYTIALTFSSIFRTILSIFFTPFGTRAYHYIGSGDDEGLKKFCVRLMIVAAPIVIIPTIAFSCVAEPFILTWVGDKYVESINFARLLPFLYTFSFISYTGAMYLVAKERIKDMYLIATVQPLIYWTGIILTNSQWGLFSFTTFKLTATIVSEIFYLYIIVTVLGVDLIKIVRKTILPILLPVTFLVLSSWISGLFIRTEKSKENFFIVVLITGANILISFVLLYMSNFDFKLLVGNVLQTVFKKKIKAEY